MSRCQKYRWKFSYAWWEILATTNSHRRSPAATSTLGVTEGKSLEPSHVMGTEEIANTLWTTSHQFCIVHSPKIFGLPLQPSLSNLLEVDAFRNIQAGLLTKLLGKLVETEELLQTQAHLPWAWTHLWLTQWRTSVDARAWQGYNRSPGSSKCAMTS